jgi:hypothetical protein
LLPQHAVLSFPRRWQSGERSRWWRTLAPSSPSLGIDPMRGADTAIPVVSPLSQVGEMMCAWSHAE